MRRARQRVEARTWDVFPNKETQRCFPKQDRSLKTDNNEFTLWRRKDCCLYPRPGGCLRCYRQIFATQYLRPKWAYPTQAAERQHGCKSKQSGSQVHSNPYESPKSSIPSNGIGDFLRFDIFFRTSYNRKVYFLQRRSFILCPCSNVIFFLFLRSSCSPRGSRLLLKVCWALRRFPVCPMC